MIPRRIAGIPLRTAVLGAVVLVVFFAGTLWALDAFFPRNQLDDKRPVLAALPPLQPVNTASYIITPITVTNTAIRDALDAAAPRNLTGKRDNPLTEVLGKADIGWTITRGPIGVTGTATGLAINTALNGTLRVTGQIANQAGNLTGAITGLLGNSLGKSVQDLTTKALDQRAEIRGNVTVTSRPQLQPNWRLEPNLSGQVALADGGLTIAGFKINVSSEVKPLLDRTVNDQIASLSNKLRNDPILEQTARREWAKACRSIPLGATAPGAPNLWLEVRPIRAAAANPRIEANAVTLTVGVQAETRIVPSATKPNCPFPQQLDIVQQLTEGKLAIALPIDVPFTELSRIMESELKGKTFGGDQAGADVTVQKATVAASGDRLLISMRVKVKERKSWFGFGAEATIHVWGKPALDTQNQIVRLTDISLDVDSQAAFGLLGTAARAAIPYVQPTLAENATVDLKPFAVSARQSIEAAIVDFQKQAEGVRAEANVTDLRLTGIEFDSKTLRVIAEADGSVRVAVSKIAVQ